MGGGILPVALYNGKLLFLFGKEAGEKKWSDFGGGREGNESKFETAIREGCEELNGFLGCRNHLRKLVKSNQLAIIDTKGLHTYIFLMDYDENLCGYFNNNSKFIKQKIPTKVNKKGLFEKSEIGWFTIEELQHSPNQFRTFYQKVIENIVLHYRDILNEAKGK
ncbi:MAG: hypothetical protein CL847_04050 [Crocinitomicaceae bacterium]|nr:hypothetical protein [Crocinitomicaceae bacterium]